MLAKAHPKLFEPWTDPAWFAKHSPPGAYRQRPMGEQQQNAGRDTSHGVSTQFFVDPSFFDWAHGVPEAAARYARSHPVGATVAACLCVLFACVLVRRAIATWKQRAKEQAESAAAEGLP